jgi:hypothetical protein
LGGITELRTVVREKLGDRMAGAATPRRLPPKIASTRARVASLTAAGASPEQLAAARADLQAAKLEDHIRKLVDGWPPLTDAQRVRLSLLLHPGGGNDHGAA